MTVLVRTVPLHEGKSQYALHHLNITFIALGEHRRSLAWTNDRQLKYVSLRRFKRGTRFRFAIRKGPIESEVDEVGMYTVTPTFLYVGKVNTLAVTLKALLVTFHIN